jgi:hypothetical protein
MDPYLEAHWGDVHHRLVTYACDQLQAALPGDLRARVEERVFIQYGEGEGRGLYPDVHVLEREKGAFISRRTHGSVGTVEPLVISLADEPLTQGFIQVVDVSSGHKVVTVIEFLSPSNKLPGEGQTIYLKKQDELRTARVSLVEIDLTRTGRRVTIAPPERLPPLHRTAYQASVWRGYGPLEVEAYPIPLRERLPTIGVPLRESEGDAPLDLQALVEQCYSSGRYDDLDYRSEPIPPLAPEEAIWSDEVLRKSGRR